MPGLSDIPLIGRLFASNHRETLQSDIILTLTPHIVRVLDLTEADLKPFRLGRDSGGFPLLDSQSGGVPSPPRDLEPDQQPSFAPPSPAAMVPPAQAVAPAAPRVTPPPFPQPLQGTMPGTPLPISQPAVPKKPGGGGS